MNNVILIGGSHHNGLGLVRSFGECGIKPYGIIIGHNSNKSFVRKSKYWKKTICIDSISELIPVLLNSFTDENEKPVLIPWSDSAALELDANLDLLLDNFILPSFKYKQGAIVQLQNKIEQINLAKKYGLPMAKSWVINFKELPIIPKDITFPCILKPVASTEGDKADIKKCEDIDGLMSVIAELVNKGYKRILCQEFIIYDYEFEFCGSCSCDSAYTITKNLRNWPLVGGTNSFFQCITDKKIVSVCMDILKSLKNEGFLGLFDIEMFCCRDRIILNEFNWRNTGNSFFAHGTGVHYAVIWYYAIIGHSELASNIKHTCYDINQFAMNEATDLRHVFYCGFPLKEWLKDLRKTKSFALWYRRDLSPSFRQYAHLLKEMIKRR